MRLPGNKVANPKKICAKRTKPEYLGISRSTCSFTVFNLVIEESVLNQEPKLKDILNELTRDGTDTEEHSLKDVQYGANNKFGCRISEVFMTPNKIMF